MAKSDTKKPAGSKKKISKKKAAKKTAPKKKSAKKKSPKKSSAKKVAASKAVKTSAAKSAKKTAISEDERRMMIAMHAYYKWESAGFPHGEDFKHWIEAEQEVNAMLK